ncbi:MAG TPA: hypothetical protein VGB77_10215 [Abditibacteriaceae bacterium]|jgi:hypothetical protein
MLQTSPKTTPQSSQSPTGTFEWRGQSEAYANALYQACLQRGLEPEHDVVDALHVISAGSDLVTWARCLTDAGRMVSEQIGARLRNKREAT